jgi:hypothetical protein
MSKEDHSKNFKIMKSKGYKVMIRGHDHNPEYTYLDNKKGIVTYPSKEGNAYRLFEDRMHTINPGALFKGSFAIIDTAKSGEKVPILEYHKL